MNWIVALILGLIIGWLIEFLIDYWFWQKRKCVDVHAENTRLKAELNNSTGGNVDVDGLRADLDGANVRIGDLGAENIRLQGEIDGLNAQLAAAPDVDVNAGSLNLEGNKKWALFAGAGGALGGLAMLFNNDADEADISAKLGEIDAELAAKADLEAENAKLKADLDVVRELNSDLKADLKAEMDTKVDAPSVDVDGMRAEFDAENARLRAEIDGLNAQLAATPDVAVDASSGLNVEGNNKWALFAGAGGALGGLAMLFSDDADEADISAKLSEIDAELAAKADLEAANADLTAKLAAAGSVDNSGLETENAELRARLAGIPAFKMVKGRDDLKLINGIGPAFERRLNAAGYINFADVCAADADALYAAVEAKEWQDIDTKEWIAQACSMKSVGDVMILEDNTVVGREGDELRAQYNTSLSEISSLKAQLAAKPKPENKGMRKLKKQVTELSEEVTLLRASGGGFGTGGRWLVGRDRLQDINGIGEAYETRLYNNGITTFYEVAAASADDLATVAGKGDKDAPADTASWISQANTIIGGSATGRNRLQDISGIGPVYEERLYANGVCFYHEIANMDADALAAAASDGDDVVTADTTEWIRQANAIVGNTFLSGTKGAVGAGGYALGYALSGGAFTGDPDNLTKIEGIGPKINELMNGGGIYTFAQLAAASVDRLKEILDGGGSRFQMHDPTTWPQQAAFARDGKWDELQAWQDALDGGRA